jgi:SAM-dependent methyltransferase
MHPDEYGRIYAAEQDFWWYRGLHTLACRMLRRYLAPRGQCAVAQDQSRPEVLDAGCGTGGMAAGIAQFSRVTALDISPHALGFCRRRGIPRLVAGSVSSLPFADGTFDAVVSLDVLYHSAVTDDLHAAREAARVLKHDGILLINLPAYDWLRSPHDVVIHTARRYTRRRVRDLMTGAGLDVEWCSHWNGLLLPIAVGLRMARRSVHGGEGRSDVEPIHPTLNQALTGVLALERGLLTIARLPMGLSVLTVARRRG